MVSSKVDRDEARLRHMRLCFGVLLLPLTIYAFVHSGWMTAAIGDVGEEIWDLFCLIVALCGLSLRALEAGYHAQRRGGGEGVYSVVRYPLYFANALIVVGLALLFKSFLLVSMLIAGMSLYYRKRIGIDDELLAAIQGRNSLALKREIPSFFPRLSLWQKSGADFSWKAMLYREAAPIALVCVLFFLIESLEGVVIESRELKFWLTHEPHWAFLLLSGSLILLGRVLWLGNAMTGQRLFAHAEAGTRDAPRSVGQALDWLTLSHLRAVSLLSFVTLLFLLQGFATLPVTSRDESRFAQPAKQMVETGDYIDIRLQEATRYRKPIGVYWLQAGAVKAAEAIGIDNARNRIEIYRLPSLLAALGTVLLTYWIALAFVSRRNALLAGLALSASTLLGVEARIATIDASMLFAATACFGALAYVYIGQDRPETSRIRAWGLAAIFWTGIGASLLLKGPIILTILGLSLATLIVRERSVRWLLRLKPLAGIVWTFALIAPWYLAIYLQTKGAFFQRSVSGDLMSRLLQPAEGHWGPPGYFWLLFWVSFWPAAILAPQAVKFAWQNRADRRVFFLISWVLPAWIMFELVVTKLPHYVLPLYPGIAILIALMLDRRVEIERRERFAGILWPLFAAAIVIAVIAMAYRFDGPLQMEFFTASVFSVALASLAAWHLLKGRAETALVVSLLAAMGTATALYAAVPEMRGLSIARELVAASRAAPCALPRVASAGYGEPNLIFYGGTNTAFVDGAGAAQFLQPNECRVAFVEARQQPDFAAKSAEIGLVTRKIGEVSGFDYSNWRNSRFDVLVREPAPR